MTPFSYTSVNAGLTGWSNVINSNFTTVARFWNQPQQVRRMYRVAASGPNGTILWLKNFPAANFTGAMVWIVDAPDGNFILAHIAGASFFPANYPTTYKRYAYSDGVAWRWVHNDQLVSGIV